MGQFRPLFVYFRPFLITISRIQIEKSIDGVLGNQTHGCQMVGADKNTELWRPPNCFFIPSTHLLHRHPLVYNTKIQRIHTNRAAERFNKQLRKN